MFLNKYEDMTNIQTSFKDTRKMAIVCLTTGEIFNSVIAAAVFMNIDPSGISKCCKNKAKSAGKHPDTGEKLVWQYYSDYIILQQQQNQIAS